MTQFLHGAEVIEIDDGSRPIQTVKSAVIGLVGTAPLSAAATAAALTIGTAILNDGLKLTAVKTGTEGNAISVEVLAPTAASSELAVTVTNNKISIQLASDESGALTTTATELASALMADPAAKALVTAAALGDGSGDVAPVSRAYLSGGENEPFPLKKPVAVAGSRKLIEKLGKEGTLPAAFDDIFDQTGALVIAVRAEKGQTEEQTQANVIEAMQAFLDSQTETGYTPRILVAPEFSQFDAVASELEAKAKRLRAIAYLDCDRTASYTDAIKRARQFGERVEITWPWVRVFDTELAKEIDRPYSARAAGLRARIDAEKGFWWSKSNQEIYGIVGTSQPVDWALGDPNTTANMLNENKVSTIIREGGFRHWGNRTCSTDPKWTFEQTRRTADMINDSVQRSHLWAVDRNITKTYVDDVISGVNAYLRELKALGAILGGECWADKELNTPATIQKGIVYFDFDFCPPYPAEHIVFRSRLNNAYLEEVFS
ncbi:phage tail sheath C-terminal domain-containing protein [Vibrio cholerae]|uniref:phage tail sheath C-terminal domain-containing protein n=1 Tax=Vibrio cholerae TaxID=666 RepID=UPI0028D9B158|nr:phage tail sheath C-terminal domain-containing protein [Vibrio cholerae]EKF9462225.1 phage tail sheath subtilisin-like domain-containing protein [Vibrio cholerae]ELJ8531202.1 phage tail sheath subtilisin-like domain-containing protein [Vibrio cholerae]ELU8572059.1 phage tail sheath subtilisin-like domain-containing protein [Vibrio cholerae]MDV2326441.1 phage tail sheath subtilisin-like domain-containing protein [Vibrio cholerae]MDV2341694.1 phage tail sheath subtilisin-like domain-containin